MSMDRVSAFIPGLIFYRVCPHLVFLVICRAIRYNIDYSRRNKLNGIEIREFCVSDVVILQKLQEKFGLTEAEDQGYLE